MKIKDIVNRDLVTRTNCEHEPIHIPGSIQPHGFLLAVNETSWKIDFCSGNISEFIAVTYIDVIGKTFTSAFGEACFQSLISYINGDDIKSALPFEIFFNENNFQCTVHKSNSVFILELEIHVPDEEKLGDAYKQTIKFVAYMNNTKTLQELCTVVAKGTREITGYDRVMVYKFDENYNGEIFAESCNDKIEPFLGLHYPHTDIPSQARDLYVKNLLRLIVDVDYTPVPVYTLDTSEDKTLDLSFSILRSTSPIHVEYLQNMGVGATLTVSLLHRGKLWGMIACHHYSPKNLSPEIRLAAKLHGQFITSQIDVRQSNEQHDIAHKTENALNILNALVFQPNFNSFREIIKATEFLEICNAEGVSLLISNKIYKNGLTPSDELIRYYSEWFSLYSKDTTFASNRMVDFIMGQEYQCDEVSGIIYHSLGSGNCVIWYRPQTISEINWGGDPDKAIVHDENGMHPRNSFKLWKEIIRCQSKKWLEPELKAAAGYANSLQKIISMILLTREEQKYRSLSKILEDTNAELENINWISTHDLQEPLRKIQMIASRALLSENDQPSESMTNTLNKMTVSANRMQTLLIDILKYTSIKHSHAAFETTDLNGIFEDTVLYMKDTISDQNVTITCDVLPVIKGIPFLLKQLFSNLMMNSVKYAFAGRNTVIKVTASETAVKLEQLDNNLGYWITFSDNGIGFEQKYAESIFNIFTRLHGQDKYNGSGVGLALCKKIMQTNNGTISAIGIPGKGAAITIYFPTIK